MAGNRRGPAPTPTKIKLMRGTARKKKTKEPEPASDATVPGPPDWLTDEAKAEWRRVAPELHAMGLLTRVDVATLAGYCQNYSRWREHEKWIDENGATFVMRDKDGRLKFIQQCPQVAIARNAYIQMLRSAQELGFTPASRTRIDVPARTEVDNSKASLFRQDK